MVGSIVRCLCNVEIFSYVLQTAGEKTVSAFPDGENLFYWVATISGPLDTVSAETDAIHSLFRVYALTEVKYLFIHRSTKV
jgi:hypothetical protein